jgi:hypothetical protein
MSRLKSFASGLKARLLRSVSKVRNVLLGCSLIEAVMAALEVVALGLTILILSLCGAEVFWPLMLSQLIFHVLTLATFGLISWMASAETGVAAAA